MLRFRILLCFMLVFGAHREHAIAQSTAHPRQAEAIAVAEKFLSFLDGADAEASYEMFARFARPDTIQAWKSKLENERKELGPLTSRTLKRVVWYQDPPSAPVPGIYAAVEFDSVYAHATQHFRYVMLHSRDGEPFHVTLDYSARVARPK